MSARSLEYKEILADIVRHAWLLDDEEKAMVCAMLSTAESRILAAMASNYPPHVNKPVDSAIRVD